jgi:hypothetical protein
MATPHTSPAHPHLPQSTLVPRVAPKRIKIGTVTLPINPQTVQEGQPAQVVMLPSMVGAIRQDFGDGPHTWTLEGHTGQAGLRALLSVRALRTRPSSGQAKGVPFLYPWKYGSRVFRVYVDDCTWTEQMTDGGFLFNYQILLREAIPQSHQPPIVKMSSRGG